MRPRGRASLQVQLPLAAASLLLLLGTAITLIAYLRVRQQSLELATSRLNRVADQLAMSVAQSAPGLIADLRAAARDPNTVRWLRGDPRADSAATTARLQALVGGERDDSFVAIWDTAGRPVFTAAAAPGIAPWVTPPAQVDSARILPFQVLADSLIYYELVAPVRDAGRVVGYVQRRSRVASDAGTRATVVALLGDSGTLLFGSSGGIWTDLESLEPAPVPAVVGAVEAVPYVRAGRDQLGVGRRIAGTGWLVAAELPRSAVFGASLTFLWQVAGIALALVAATALVSWLLTRRITRPLQSLSETAEAIRAGDLDRRADPTGHPDVAAVAEAFNQMAEDSARTIHSLHVNEERLRSLITATAQMVWLTDPQGRSGDQLDGWRRFTGMQPEAITGEGWLEAIHPDDREQLLERWNEAIRHGTEFDAEYRARRRDGEYRWLHSRGVPVLNPDDTIREWIGAATDITATRQIAAQLERKEQELIQAQRLDAIGRLAGGVAHDFNNLLTAIIVPAELALEQLPPDSPLRSDLMEIRDAGKRATELTAQLLAFGRQQVLNPSIIVFDEVIETAGRIAKRLIPESIEVVFHLDGGNRRVRVDPTQLEQVVINLVVNARDAMPNGGRLVIETRVEDLAADDVADHEGVEPGRYLVLAVTDTGIGMDAATRERIFDPFFTTKEKGRGTGLGLATVYGIVRQSGGHIWFYSEPGHGTVVKIYIPESHESHERIEDTGSHPVAALIGSGTVLFAEDDPALRRIGERMLRRLGYDVLVAANGTEALALSEARPGSIALLVTDVVMPGMNGTQLAEAIRRQRPSLPVLFLSGWTGDDAVREWISEGRAPFLQKPFTLESLGRKIREVLAGTSNG